MEPAATITRSQDFTTASPFLRLLPSALPRELAGRLRRARELVPERPADRPPEPPRLTSLPALDRLLPAGLPRGELVEIVGRRTSGRFSTVLAVLAAATGGGEAAALVDLGDSLSPRAAAAAGVDLERLLWLRPRDLKQTLAAAEILLQGGLPWVVVDLGLPPIRGGRGAEAGWLRLARAARDHRAVILISAPYRASGTAAAAVLRARRGRVRWATSSLLTAIDACFEVEKARGRSPGGRGEMSFHPDTPWSRSRLAPLVPPDSATMPAPMAAPAPSPARRAAGA